MSPPSYPPIAVAHLQPSYIGGLKSLRFPTEFHPSLQIFATCAFAWE